MIERTSGLVAAASAFILIGTVYGETGQTNGDVQSQLLVEPTELAKPEVAASFVILDARIEKDFAAAHIPAARWVPAPEWAKAFGDGQDAAAWSERISALGISNSSRVVVYDDSGMRDAARVWWILRYWGVADVRLLQGGWRQWTAGRFPVTESKSEVRRTDFVARPRSELLATKQSMLDALKTRQLQILDVRSEKEFSGADPMTNKRGGAIPGAKHLEWSQLLEPDTQRFKSAAELGKMFRDAGIDPQRPIASYCQSGGRASVAAFALELVGGRDVRNYYRGWSEWGNAEDTPAVVSAQDSPSPSKSQVPNAKSQSGRE